jgi:hypothetical protein
MDDLNVVLVCGVTERCSVALLGRGVAISMHQLFLDVFCPKKDDLNDVHADLNVARMFWCPHAKARMLKPTSSELLCGIVMFAVRSE